MRNLCLFHLIVLGIRIVIRIIHLIFSFLWDWSKCVTWLNIGECPRIFRNFENCACCPKYLNGNKHNVHHKAFKICSDSLSVDIICSSKLTVKVIPLKFFYYQTFFETWHNEHSWYEHYKNAIKNGVVTIKNGVVYASAGS